MEIRKESENRRRGGSRRTQGEKGIRSREGKGRQTYASGEGGGVEQGTTKERELD